MDACLCLMLQMKSQLINCVSGKHHHFLEYQVWPNDIIVSGEMNYCIVLEVLFVTLPIYLLLIVVLEEDYYLPIVVVGNKIDLLPASEISGIYKEDRKTSTSTPPSVEENKDDISENGETWKESPPTATRILSSSSSISDSLKPSARDTVKKWCSEV